MGGGVASFSSKLKCIHPTHPSATTDLFFSYYLIAFSLWRAGGEGEGNGHSGLKTNSLKKCWHQMKGGLLTWWVGFLPLASAACWDHVSVRLSQGLLISRPWDGAWGTTPGQTRAPPEKKSPPPTQPATAPLLHPPEPIAGVVRLEVQGSEKIKCMEYKGLNWIAFSLLLGEGSLGG